MTLKWLKSPLVLLGLDVTSAQGLVRAAAEAIGAALGVEAGPIEAAFEGTMEGGSISVGRGVAIPHTEYDDLAETVVCLVTLREPLPLSTVDDRPPDIFFFVLSKPEPHHHLQLLAHLARLAQSNALLDGLRKAETPDDVAELLRTAEMRPVALSGSPLETASHVLFFVSLGGEEAVDALLVDLVDQGFGDACVLEAQSLHEATAREVPLFAGFRDLFGDPGGCRLLILQAAAERVEAVIGAVKRVSDEHRAMRACVSVVPMQSRWIWSSVADDEAPGED